MIYQFKTGKIYRGVEAQAAGAELERIRLSNGGKLTTESVVEAAASLDSPIHTAFTWDDEKAAQEYRLHEGRQLIRAVVVVHKAGSAPQPAYWNVSVTIPGGDEPDTSERYYQSASVVARSPEEYESALKVMLREIASAQHGLEQLHMLAPRRDRIMVTRAAKSVEVAHRTLTDLVPAS